MDLEILHILNLLSWCLGCRCTGLQVFNIAFNIPEFLNFGCSNPVSNILCVLELTIVSTYFCQYTAALIFFSSSKQFFSFLVLKRVLALW